MAVDHVRFCVDKYLKHSYAFRYASARPDLADRGKRLLLGRADAGEVLGVQTVDEHSDEVSFVVAENGLLINEGGHFVPYQSISSVRTEYENKQDFRGMDLELDDGSTIWLKVESGHGNVRDAFAVSSFLGNLLLRLRQAHPAYRTTVG